MAPLQAIDSTAFESAKGRQAGKALIAFAKSLLVFGRTHVYPVLFTMGNQASDPMLSKLFSADAELAAQEAQLNALLADIQAKRASLKTVLDIFDADTPTLTASNVENTPTQSPDGDTDAAEDKPAKATSKTRPQPSTHKPAQPPKAARKSQSSRRGWQAYMRDEYLQTPLPDVVAGILKGQPKKAFEIAEVVNTIVVNDIPRAERKNARNRISNILAEGARQDRWVRPNPGVYRFSQ